MYSQYGKSETNNSVTFLVHYSTVVVSCELLVADPAYCSSAFDIPCTVCAKPAHILYRMTFGLSETPITVRQKRIFEILFVIRFVKRS